MNSHPIRTAVLVVVLWGQQLEHHMAAAAELKVQVERAAHLAGVLRLTELRVRHSQAEIATMRAAAVAAAGSVAVAEQISVPVRYGADTAAAVDRVM
jgi:Xaa-Pro aminopeptidase